MQKILILASLLILTGCAKSLDDDVEAQFRPAFDEAIDRGLYCEAVEIVEARFSYADDPSRRISERELLKRAEEWMKLGSLAKEECTKSLWPKKEQNIQVELKELTELLEKLRQINRFKVSVGDTSNTFRKKDGFNYTTVDVVNNSDFTINGFTIDNSSLGVEQYQVSSFEYPSEKRSSGSGYLSDNDYDDFQDPIVFEPNSAHKVDAKLIALPHYADSPSQVDFYVTSINALDGEKYSTFDRSEIIATEKRIAELNKALEEENPFK